MKTFSIWLVFDLGLKGDYKSLYTWLANKKADECGSNTAFFTYKSRSQKNQHLLEALKADLNESVNLASTDRIYVIFKEKGGTDSGGVFINGGRRQAPWTGYEQEHGVKEFAPEG